MRCMRCNTAHNQQHCTHKSRRQEKHLQKIPFIVFVHSLLICTSSKRQSHKHQSLLVIRNCYLSHKWTREKQKKSPPAAMKPGQLLLSEAKRGLARPDAES